jgi:hypothetical protein
MRASRPLDAILCAALIALAVSCFFPEARAEFQKGPLLVDTLPAERGSPVIWTGRKVLVRETLPSTLVAAVKECLDSGKTILLVGHTDAVGPRVLNRSLGMQYAVDTAHRLAQKLGVGPWRFICASQGEEDGKPEGGVEVFAWMPAAPVPLEPPNPMRILSPTPGGVTTPVLWAMWDYEVGDIVWGRVEDGVLGMWQIETPEAVLHLPFPARSLNSAIGGVFPDGRFLHEGRWTEPPVDPLLTMSVEALETGWARLAGRLPPEYRSLTVWAGGIPYPAIVEGGKYEVNVARYVEGMPTYAQASDEKGNTVVGPLLRLPAGAEQSPRLIAVLTWQGEGADLDLHGWSDSGHTQPTDPDPRVSRTAARGVRLLFDGDARHPVSALWVDDPKNLEVEVHCFNDFGGGAEAFLYVIENPADPVMRKGRIIGPRKLSMSLLQERWPALSVRGESK